MLCADPKRAVNLTWRIILVSYIHSCSSRHRRGVTSSLSLGAQLSHSACASVLSSQSFLADFMLWPSHLEYLAKSTQVEAGSARTPGLYPDRPDSRLVDCVDLSSLGEQTRTCGRRASARPSSYMMGRLTRIELDARFAGADNAAHPPLAHPRAVRILRIQPLTARLAQTSRSSWLGPALSLEFA